MANNEHGPRSASTDEETIRAPSFRPVLAKGWGVILAVAILAVGNRAAARQAHSLLNRPAPEFARQDLNAHRVDLRALRGKVVLLTFWATWCVPCQIEMPRFVEWQHNYGPAGLRIVGISMDDDAAPVRELCREDNVNYPVVMGDAKLGLRFGGVLGLPLTFLIDRRGGIRAEFKGEADLHTMENAITSHLGKRK